MKKLFLLLVCVLSAGWLSFLGSTDAEAFLFDGFMNRVAVGGVGIDSYVKIGYQRMSVNLNIPVPPSSFIPESEDIDAKMAKQDFAIGSLGVGGLLGQRFGLSAEASISAENSGAVETFTSYSFWGGGGGPQGLTWASRRVRWWEVDLRGSVNILNSGMLLLGYKFDRLTQKLERSREQLVRLEIDYLGDLDIRMWSPYIGFRFDDGVWRFDLIWSPWLTSYRADMPLRWIEYNTQYLEESRYGLGGKGGNLLEAYGEARSNFLGLPAAKLWGKVSWLNCRGSGDRDLSSSDPWFESNSATGSLTRYLWAVGIAGDVRF